MRDLFSTSPMPVAFDGEAMKSKASCADPDGGGPLRPPRRDHRKAAASVQKTQPRLSRSDTMSGVTILETSRVGTFVGVFIIVAVFFDRIRHHREAIVTALDQIGIRIRRQEGPAERS